MEKHGIIEVLIKSMIGQAPMVVDADEEYASVAAYLLMSFLKSGGKLSDSEKEQIHPLFENAMSRSVWGLDAKSWELLRENVCAHD